MQQDMFVLKDDALGTIYTRNAALGYVREIPQDLRGKGGFAGDVEIRYLWGSSDWLSDADWARIKPLVVAKAVGQDDLLAALELALKEGVQMAKDLEQARARIKALEQHGIAEDDLTTEAGFEQALRSDMAQLMTQPADTPPPPRLPEPTTFEAEMQKSGEVSSNKPAPAPAAPLHNVVRVKCGTFYSTTSRSNRAQWTCYTDGGLTVNMFDHSDPLRDHKKRLEAAGYLAFFQTMKAGETAYWKTNPIRVSIKANGKFWDLVSIEPRPADAAPDDPSDVVELSPVQLAVCREAKALLEKDPTIFDCEATGIGDDDEIVQIGGATGQGGFLFNEMVKPLDMKKLRRPGKNKKTSVDIHGITEDMLKDAHTIGDESGQVGWIFDTYFHNKVWAAFNIDYDVRVMRQSWDLAGCLDKYFPVAQERVCVQQLMNRYLGHDYTSMDESCKALGIKRNETHRAFSDARDTAAILRALAAKVPADDPKHPF